MADTPYKRTDMRPLGAPESPPGWDYRGGAPLSRGEFARLCYAQDKLLGGARIVAMHHTGGLSDGWLVVDGPTGGSSWPDSSTARVMFRAMLHLTPGSDVECRVLSIGSGGEDTTDTVDGAVSFTAQIKTAANTSAAGSKAADLGDSPLTYGDVGTSASWYWHHLGHTYLRPYRPGSPGAMMPAERATWSEDATLHASLAQRGGARIISACLSEAAWYHSAAHDTDDRTVHGAGAKNPTLHPQESAADGATYEERRYGTHALLDVAERQATRLGPVIWTWSSYTEQLTAPADAEAAPLEATGTTPISLYTTSISEWDYDEPGFAMPCCYAEDDHDVATMAGASVAPVRISVYHSTTVGGRLRVQTTGRSWIDVDLPVTSGYEWTTVTGYLECDPAPDVHRAVGQALLSHDSGGSVALRYVVVTWGHMPITL